MIATAIPRCRVNHKDVSAMTGANAIELATPISRPWASTNCQRVVAWLETKYPSPRPSVPATTGAKMPKRSDSRPIRMPPKPKQIIVAVYGSDAAERATPNSACTAGRTTMTDHMPTPPMAESSSAAKRRTQAYGDSGMRDSLSIAAPDRNATCGFAFVPPDDTRGCDWPDRAPPVAHASNSSRSTASTSTLSVLSTALAVAAPRGRLVDQLATTWVQGRAMKTIV